MALIARELTPREIPLAEMVWEGYRQQKADRKADRIFGAFLDGTLASVARCKRHPDGLEVDGVYTADEFRGRGLARSVVGALVAGCGNGTLYMHSTLALVPFYATFGFIPISEDELPQTIRERLVFCLGEMEACNARPMRRSPGPLLDPGKESLSAGAPKGRSPRTGHLPE